MEDILKLNAEQDQLEESTSEYSLEEDEGKAITNSDEDTPSEQKVTNEGPDKQANELKTKRPKREEYKVIRYQARESAAFAASRIPSCYGSTLRVLNEISKREPDYKPETLMDFGSGVGTAIWAAHETWGSSLKEYQCIDISEHMNSLAEFLLRGSDSYRQPLYIPHVYFKRFLPISNKVTYDVVISSYSLSEIPHVALKKEVLRNLWAKANDFLVLVEYGNNEGFETLLEARKIVEADQEISRDSILENESTSETSQGVDDYQTREEFPFETTTTEEGFVYAPCPHDHPCARSDAGTRDHPCNFEQRVQLSLVEKFTGLKKWGYVTERFSYLVLRKGERRGSDHSWPRLLEPVRLRGKHVICRLCSSNGDIEQKVLSKKKDSDVYKCVRHLSKWGDLVALPDDRVRPLNNPDITVTRRGKLRK
ncbi:methyltransferase-like protein 17, mitochondrial isoform X2 [Nematostella vectensis]|nr:methyltransferase-like protein 17, mitochondrial isoform X2 [Nematostella vectensis]